MEKIKKNRIKDRAKNEVNGSNSMIREQKVILGGMSPSTLFNYGMVNSDKIFG